MASKHDYERIEAEREAREESERKAKTAKAHEEEAGRKAKAPPEAERDPRDGDRDLRGLRADNLPTISGGLGGENVDQAAGRGVVGVEPPRYVAWPHRLSRRRAGSR
jgi:predicted flap endonuclease-1-like 5' DNA nuclease